MNSNAAPRPTTSAEIFSQELLDNPFDTYRELRDQAGAVFVPEHNFWIIPRYDDVRAATLDYARFSSATGVALLDQFNAPMLGSVLASDPPLHTQLRSVLAERLAPRALRELQSKLQVQIDDIVDRALSSLDFDGVTDLAQKIPVKVVGDLIGVPQEGREMLLPGADAVFTSFGPLTPTLEERMPAFMSYVVWMSSFAETRTLTPGSWGAEIMEGVDRGDIPAESAVGLLNAYLVAGLDTTSNGISSMLRFIAEKPEVWQALREDPSLGRGLFEEVLRLESPVVGFFRNLTEDVEIDGTVVPGGDRVLLHFASANRDERHYSNPDTFELRRNPVDHLAFGYGNHACAGQGLARMEAHCLLTSLLARVETIELAGEPVRHYNPVIRGAESLPLRVRLAA